MILLKLHHTVFTTLRSFRDQYALSAETWRKWEEEGASYREDLRTNVEWVKSIAYEVWILSSEMIESAGDIRWCSNFFEDTSHCNQVLRSPLKMCNTFQDVSKWSISRGERPMVTKVDSLGWRVRADKNSANRFLRNHYKTHIWTVFWNRWGRFKWRVPVFEQKCTFLVDIVPTREQ